jgi:protein-S-isoprenylcysteine O-methyltransferase Ste14
LGLIAFITAIFNIATTPPGEPFSKELYRYSRHPMTFFAFFTYIGIGLTTASWLFLLLSAVTIILQIFTTMAEERGCLEQYGDSYQEYLNRTPRWIGVPK